MRQTGTITALGNKGYGFLDGHIIFYVNEIHQIDIDGCTASLARGVSYHSHRGDVILQVGDAIRYELKRTDKGFVAVDPSLVFFTPSYDRVEAPMTREQKNKIGALLDTPLAEGGIPWGDLRKSLGALKHMQTTIGTKATADQAQKYIDKARHDYPQCATLLTREFALRT